MDASLHRPVAGRRDTHVMPSSCASRSRAQLATRPRPLTAFDVRMPDIHAQVAHKFSRTRFSRALDEPARRGRSDGRCRGRPLAYTARMRVAGFAVLLVACGERGESTRPIDIDIDAPTLSDALLDFEHCDSPVGTAAITAAHQDLQSQYSRMYVGGFFSSSLPLFTVRPFFTNEALTTVQDVIDCADGRACTDVTGVGFVVHVTIERGAEIGAHPAEIRDSAHMWEASGTVTLTDLVYPQGVVGHVAGSIHVESADPQLTIDGSFDHSFCPALVNTDLF
ncbi:MAG: hypothetical protein WKG01_35055 [Kofleriaceae bacterium]